LSARVAGGSKPPAEKTKPSEDGSNVGVVTRFSGLVTCRQRLKASGGANTNLKPSLDVNGASPSPTERLLTSEKVGFGFFIGKNLLKLDNLIAQQRRFLEFERLGGVFHLGFEFLNHAVKLVFGEHHGTDDAAL
jgi:hypothetical protein